MLEKQIERLKAELKKARKNNNEKLESAIMGKLRNLNHQLYSQREHSGKTTDELKSELAELRKKLKKAQKENNSHLEIVLMAKIRRINAAMRSAKEQIEETKEMDWDWNYKSNRFEKEPPLEPDWDYEWEAFYDEATDRLLDFEDYEDYFSMSWGGHDLYTYVDRDSDPDVVAKKLWRDYQDKKAKEPGDDPSDFYSYPDFDLSENKKTKIRLKFIKG